MNDIPETAASGVEPMQTDSKDFSHRWAEMMEDTFAVAMEELETEISALETIGRKKFTVTDVVRKGRIVSCSVAGFVPQLAQAFREGTELKLKSWGSRTSGQCSVPVTISAISRGFSVEEFESFIGSVRLRLDLTSKGELHHDGNVKVSADTESRKNQVERRYRNLREFLDNAQSGNLTDLQRRFIAGDFIVRPGPALSKSTDLDSSQNNAYGRAMLFEEYPILFVQGPPGTGKTRTIREIIDGHIQHGRKVLVLSHSHRGKDEPAKQLLAKWTGVDGKRKAKRTAEKRGDEKIFIAGNLPEKIDPDLRRFRIKKDHQFPEAQLRRVDAMSEHDLLMFSYKLERRGGVRFTHKVGFEGISDLRNQVKEAIIFDHEKRCAKAERKFSEGIENGGAVFSTFGNLVSDKLLAKTGFDVVIVDESTRMQAPELVMALQKAGTQIIFVGDPEQLGNIPMDPETEKSLAAKLEGVEVPEIISGTRGKIKRLYDAEAASRALETFNEGPYTSGIKCAENPDRELPFVFLDQGRRSLPNITRLVSEFTYGGRLKPAREALEEGDEGQILWIDTRNLRGSEKASGTSRRNPTESLIIGRKVVDALLRRGLSPSQIGVIATYASQVVAIRNGIGRILRGSENGKALYEDLEPSIDSVDGFQGDQRDFVFMSFVRSNKAGAVGFADERSRINVGISRAGDCLVIVGDTSTLIDNNQDPVSRARFEKLRDLVAKHGEVREIKFHQERKRKRDPNKRRAARKNARKKRREWAAVA